VIGRHLVELMGGTIHGRQRAGQGSIFWFEVPLEAGARPRSCTGDGAPPHPRGPMPAPPGPRPARVLVVEDNAVNCLVVQAMLERLGMTRHLGPRRSAQAVAARSSALEVDLVLMDCQMPVMDGYEATRQHPRERTSARPACRSSR
jgi:PleD family two-component response regulator